MACAVIVVRKPACSEADWIDSRRLVKLRFTGILPARMTARFATRPPLPGGRKGQVRFGESDDEGQRDSEHGYQME